MSSDHDRGRQGNAIHFFKIIRERSLRDGELVIPRRFVKKYGEGLSNPVHLRLPNGADWKVFWIKRDSDILFQNGWIRFAEYYSLSYGHFLVFRYEGRSQFQVRIFDMSTLEIDYSSIRCTDDGEKTRKRYEECEESEEISEESDHSVEFLGESGRPRSPLPFSQPQKKKKSNTNGKPKSYFNPHFETKGAQSQRTKLRKTKINVGLDATRQKVTGASRRGLFNAKNCSKTEAIKKETLERAKTFSSEKPFFIRPLHPSYLQRDSLVIESDFSRKYLDGMEGTTATIGVCEDRTWPVTFKFNISSNQTTMTTGWLAFAKEYNLKHVDVCVFEMTELTPVSFKVIIFRAREEPSSEQLQDSESPKSSSKFMEKNNFKVFVKDYHLSTTPSIPYEFMKRYTRCHGKYVELQVGEKSWDVKVIYYPHRSCGRFSAGWSTFVRECLLKVGDTCLLEMIDEENLVLKVSITRHHH